jgi:hypothetical protein
MRLSSRRSSRRTSSASAAITGTRYRSLEALDRGLDAVIAEFQHILAGLAERRQAKIDRLQLAGQRGGDPQRLDGRAV